MEASERVAASVAAEEPEGIARPERTLRIGRFEVDLPPDPTKPLDVSHYVTKHLEDLWRQAGWWAKSGAVPPAVANNQAGCFAVLCTGMELGLAPATAFRSIHPITTKDKEGFRLAFSADLLAGLAIQAGVKYQVTRSDAKGCRIEWRRGDTFGVSEFTEVDAQRAGLLDKPGGMYQKWPQRMYRSRAFGFMARDAAPDRCMTLHTLEEIIDNAAEPERFPTREEVESRHVPPPDAKEAAAEIRKQGEREQAYRESQRTGRPANPDAITQPQKAKLMKLANDLKIADKSEIDGEIRTIICTTDEINAALGWPEGKDAVLRDLSKREAGILIETLEARLNRADAGEALGE